jgi:hypothetical protein
MTDGTNLKSLLKILSPILIIFCLECSNTTQLPTPEKIGDKERFRVISGNQAAHVVNKMHGQTVAADTNVIVEYGTEKKDLLYISYYRDQKEANDAFQLMIEKMTSSKKGPFFHLIPLTAYKNEVYFTLGMGAGHYIFLSGKYLLWFQTYQSFGDRLPPQLLKFYPA